MAQMIFRPSFTSRMSNQPLPPSSTAYHSRCDVASDHAPPRMQSSSMVGVPRLALRSTVWSRKFSRK